MPETASNTGRAKQDGRPWYRPHRSTCVLLLLVAVGLVLMIAPGESSGVRAAQFDDGWICWEYHVHGWPWDYLQRTTRGPDLCAAAVPWPEIPSAGWLSRRGWAFTGDETEFHLKALLFDAAIGLVILFAAAAAWEWRRRRYRQVWQFSLRELLAMALLLAAALAWWQVQLQRCQREDEIARRIEPFHAHLLPTYRPPKWLRRLVGYRGLAALLSGDFAQCDSYPIPAVFRGGTEVLFDLYATDEDLMRAVPYLKRLPHLETVSCAVSKVTDDGLAVLGELTRLDELKLYSTGVTDAGLAHLAPLTNLNRLDLGGTQVSDAGVVHLKRLVNLERLDLHYTGVTSEGVNELKQALPDCEVFYLQDDSI